MGKDALIIIGLIVVLGALAIGINKIGRPQMNNGSTGTAQPAYLQTPEHPLPIPITEEQRNGSSYAGQSGSGSGEPTQQEVEQQIRQAQAELALLEQKRAEAEKYGEQSPYKGMVTMTKSWGGTYTTDPDQEYIQLTAAQSNTEPVRITGWKLSSAIIGKTVTIPGAAYLYFAGGANTEQPIELAPGDVAYIITGRSPVGYSFLVNECTGYITQFQKLVPSLSLRCPRPEDEIRSYTGDQSVFIDNACMDYVENMSRCRVPTSPLPLKLSYACQDAIVSEINYPNCIKEHKDDPDFRQSDWRIYLKRDTELWREKRELILLTDENGKTVDYYEY